MVTYILAFIAVAAIIGIDQYTKHIIETTMELGTSKNFIKGFIDISFIKNSGSAWGMLSGHTWLLLSITFIVMLVLIALLLKYGGKNKLLFWSVVLIMSGGMGNMIDRIFKNGMVVDFLHFEFFPTFPVFNIADCAIVLGAGLLIVYFICDTLKEKKAKKEAMSEKI